MARKNHVYHWKHGWIPLDHVAALSKAKGSPEGAKRIAAKHGIGQGGSKPMSLRNASVSIRKSMNSGNPTRSVANPTPTTRRTLSDRLNDPNSRVQALSEAMETGDQRRKRAAAGVEVMGGRVTRDGRHVGTVEKFPTGGGWMAHDASGQPLGKTFKTKADAVGELALRDPDAQRAEKALTQSARAAELRDQAAAERAKLQGIADGAGVGRLGITDPQANRLSGRGLAQAHRNTDSSLRRYTETQQRANALESKAHLAEARAKEAGRTRLTQADVKGATHIQDEYGWHEVVRVNAKTVTVKTPYSWTETIPIVKVRKTLTATPEQIAAAKKKRAS